MNSYSPNLVSKVPCCKLINLSVNLGPISCKSALVPFSSNIYLIQINIYLNTCDV